MITNNFTKELRGISDALRVLGYPGYNRYDDETKIFIERHLGKERLKLSRSLHFFPYIQNFSLNSLFIHRKNSYIKENKYV